MRENFIARLQELPDLLGGHLVLSISAIIVGLVISVPLGVVASRSPRLRNTFLAIASVTQTIPSMALLALMVPLLGGMIGFLPAFLALTMYSMLPMLRNTVTGLTEVDPAIIEAARGVGMTERQQLFQVEIPLALPMIIAGIRTAAVWVVGTATLSTPIGAASLGNYIFAGLQTRNWLSVLFGCVFAALLAIFLDSVIRLMEVAVRRRDRSLTLTGALILLVALGAGTAPVLYGHLRPTQSWSGAGRPVQENLQLAHEPLLAGQRVTIGSKPFTEQYILANLLKRQLESQGALVENIENMGSTILFDALARNTVDLYVDYTGTIWTTILNRQTPQERTGLFIDVAKHLKEEYGVLTIGRLGFDNSYCLAMRRERSKALGIRSIEDLARRSADWVLGGDPEFFGRPEWVSVRDAYQLGHMSTRGMDATFMYGAVRDGEVDVIGAYTTDGRIGAYDLVILRDPKRVFPPYDAILLFSPRAAKIPNLVEVATRLVNSIDDEMMREANRRVDIERQPPEQAAGYLHSILESR